ncbi:MAG: YciI family protein [Pseudomonadota bacterium]
MQFMVLRKAGPETETGDDMPSAELISAMGKYNQQLVDAGVMREGAGLKPSAHGVRLRLAPGQVTVTDGPFAEAKELVAGFSIFEVASKQEAIDWLRRWPVEDADGNVALEVRECGCPGGCAGVATLAAPDAGGKRFVVLLRSDAFTESDAAPEQHKLDALDAFNVDQVKAGVLLAGDGLKSSARGARIKFEKGRPTVVDGPFTEIKELIAGYWMIRVASLDAAIAWARQLPYPTGPEVEVEIRPLYELEDFGVAFDAEVCQAEERMRARQLEEGMRAQLAAAPPTWR